MIIDKNSPVPQYFQLQTWLMEQIDQGVFKPGDRIPTEEELSGITGLARATIRQAVQNLVNMGHLERKRRLGTFVLSREQTRDQRPLIGILIPDIRSGYAPELARGAQDEAARSQYSLILCNTDDLAIKAAHHADRLIEHRVGGVIFVPTAAPDQQNIRILETFRQRGIPVVLADRPLADAECDLVTTDNFEGGRTAVRHLVSLGHTRVAVILSTLYSSERARLAGFHAALAEAGVTPSPELIVTTDDPFSEKKCEQQARALLKRYPGFSAVFAGHDRIAYQVMAAADDMGIRIPADISLVGYDDLNIPHSVSVPLTTMHQPIYEMGVESMKQVMRRVHGDTGEWVERVLTSRLVERSSVAELRPGRR
ncbi:GntR family transcriptional regulator [bacterium]|nr:GntR family transcriptional regulator [bacterium]